MSHKATWHHDMLLATPQFCWMALVMSYHSRWHCRHYWLTYRVVTRVCHMRGPNVHVTFCCHMHSNWFEFMWHVMVSNCIKTYMSHEVTSRLVWQDLYNKNVKVWSSGVMYQSFPILPIPPGTCGAFDNLAVPRVGYFPAKVRTCRFCWQENEPQ